MLHIKQSPGLSEDRLYFLSHCAIQGEFLNNHGISCLAFPSYKLFSFMVSPLFLFFHYICISFFLFVCFLLLFLLPPEILITQIHRCTDPSITMGLWKALNHCSICFFCFCFFPLQEPILFL